MTEDPMRGACSERCAEFGDPPCYSLEGVTWPEGACDDCRREAGLEVFERLDPEAVVRPLL